MLFGFLGDYLATEVDVRAEKGGTLLFFDLLQLLQTLDSVLLVQGLPKEELLLYFLVRLCIVHLVELDELVFLLQTELFDEVLFVLSLFCVEEQFGVDAAEGGTGQYLGATVDQGTVLQLLLFLFLPGQLSVQHLLQVPVMSLPP